MVQEYRPAWLLTPVALGRVEGILNFCRERVPLGGLAQKPISATLRNLLIRLGRRPLCETAQKHQLLGRQNVCRMGSS